MREFQEKRKIRKILFSQTILVFVLLLLMFLMISVVKMYMKSREASFLNSKIEKELSDLEERKKSLEKDIFELKTETGLEREIREKFNVVKPEEEVLNIVDRVDVSDDSTSTKKSKSFFSKIFLFWRD